MIYRTKKEVYSELDRRIAAMSKKEQGKNRAFYIQVTGECLQQFPEARKIPMSGEYEEAYVTFYGANEKNSLILLLK